MVRDIELMRGPGWPSTLGMDPYEVAGGLCNSGGWSLRGHVPEPSAKKVNLAVTLRMGLWIDFALDKIDKW